MENVYRNYSSTQQKIQMVSQLRITNREEAVAFLRAVANINEQIAAVLQRENLQDLAIKNRKIAQEKKPEVIQEEAVAAIATEVVEEDVPNFEETETHSEEDVVSRIKQLKKAKK